MVLASKNPHKLTEMSAILSQLGIEVVLESDVGVDVDVEETGTTFEENAALKARAVMEASGLPAIADDSGLCVTALGDGPGVYSARYGGEGLTDQDRYGLVLKGLSGQLDRSAKFVSAICCAFPGGDTVTARGECPGLIAYAPMGEDGFGYDPVFLVPEKKKTFAQMTAQEKNAISHRGVALQKFKAELEKYLTKPAP
jgi:XTP/dITP diphosphohydrolase